NYSLDGLVGFNLYQKTVGIIGVGKIGKALAKIMNGFECRILGYDIDPDVETEKKYNITYTSLEHLCRSADIISLHLPLSDATKHLINEKTLKLMKYNVMIINTARGAIINTKDLIKHLKSKHIGYAGLDVYENEKGIFFMNHYGKKVEDRYLLELLEMPNVLITPHQAFATTESLERIAQITFHNLYCWANQLTLLNELKVQDEKIPSIVTY
ncbi:MAG: 2-hydroxyacid dehydrogenase, partial [Ferruginibacter sp.]|nr:2-hydroxyacid dehydrogenase [Ferruginibacter sp.]